MEPCSRGYRHRRDLQKRANGNDGRFQVQPKVVDLLGRRPVLDCSEASHDGQRCFSCLASLSYKTEEQKSLPGVPRKADRLCTRQKKRRRKQVPAQKPWDIARLPTCGEKVGEDATACSALHSHHDSIPHAGFCGRQCKNITIVRGYTTFPGRRMGFDVGLMIRFAHTSCQLLLFPRSAIPRLYVYR